MASASTLEKLLHSEVEHLIALRCLTIAGITVFLYDSLLTFSEEIKYVWTSLFLYKSRQLSRGRLVSKVLYLCMKSAASVVGILYLYVILPSSSLTSDRTFWLYINLERFSCKTIIIAVFGVDFFVEYVGNGVILYRLLMLWDFDRVVVRRLATAFVLSKFIVLGFALATLILIQEQITFAQVGSIRACIALSAPIVEVGTWAITLFIDIGAFAVFLLNAFSRPRTDRQRLTSILYKDGILFFLPAICMRTINLVLATTRSSLLFYLTIVFSSLVVTVATCRSYLNLFALNESRRLQEINHFEGDGGVDDEGYCSLALITIPESRKCG